jgi:hypothetical protein
LQVLPRFLWVFEKIEKVTFLLLLPFLWGEQDSNVKLETAVYATFVDVLKPMCTDSAPNSTFTFFQYEIIIKNL